MRYCKTKIVAMPIPSTDDVAQIKAEKVMEEIGRIIDEENLKDTIDIIESRSTNLIILQWTLQQHS